MEHKRLSVTEIEELSYNALIKHGASDEQAKPLARSIAETEAYGIKSHGLLYLPVYILHLKCGKVLGDAVPTYTQTTSVLGHVDAKNGFAHAAIKLGFNHMIDIAKNEGMAAIAIKESYNCGVLGYHTEMLAKQGLVGLGFTNAPASIAPPGGSKKVVGTNPYSLAIPKEHPEHDNDALDYNFVIDQSASVVAKSELIKHQSEGKEIPLGWALDADGNPTSDPSLGLKGSMVPTGGYKGFSNALLVETFAAALSGAFLGMDAAPFAGDAGGPPRTGQFFIAINPRLSAGDGFFGATQRLCSMAIADDESLRLPGQRRAENRLYHLKHGVDVPENLLEKIMNA